MKKIWIVANWKSNKTIAEALEWVGLVGPKIPKDERLSVWVCPPFNALGEVKKAVQVGGFSIRVGVQNVSQFGVGAYTGEVAAQLLSELADLAILGHSERRNLLGETDEMVARKVAEVAKVGIEPLVCVQDSETQVPAGVKLVAYEPVFAIGTGTPDTPENAAGVARSLKKVWGQNLEVLYGGSVNGDNTKAFLQREEISGLLVGGPSLEADSFLEIIDRALEA